MAQKVTKAEAEYEPKASMPEHHCGVCKHFAAPHGCDKVEGKIDSGGWCKFFRMRRIKG